MNLAKYILLFSIIILALSSCRRNPYADDSKQAKLHDEVMKIHDEVMPKTADINRIQRKLKKYMKAQGEEINPAEKEVILDVMTKLTKADDMMSSWMKEFKAPKADVPEAVALKYLNLEKLKITKVGEAMLSSISEGKSVLETLKIK